MKFQPKTEDEVQSEELCPEGKQPFTVLDCQEALSKKGTPMLKLKLNVHADDGSDYHVYDYISTEFMGFKFRHFFFSVGAGSQYETGSIDANAMIDRKGWAEIARQGSKRGYGPKAIVADYLMENEEAKKKPEVAPDGAVPAAEDDDSVPF